MLSLKRKRSLSPTLIHADAEPNSWPKRLHTSLSPSGWHDIRVTVRVGVNPTVFKVNAGQLRKKSDYFASVMRDYWHESTEILLPHIEPCGWEIYKDWLYDREPRWFKHYSSVNLAQKTDQQQKAMRQTSGPQFQE